jgi:hypothetical protein
MGKDEYDTFVKAEEEAALTTGSVFQGLRIDLEGFVAWLRATTSIDHSSRTGSTRVFIVSTCCVVLVGGLTLVGPLDGSNNWYRRAYGGAVHSDSGTRVD